MISNGFARPEYVWTTYFWETDSSGLDSSGANMKVADDDEEMQGFSRSKDLLKGRHFDGQIIVWRFIAPPLGIDSRKCKPEGAPAHINLNMI